MWALSLRKQPREEADVSDRKNYLEKQFSFFDELFISNSIVKETDLSQRRE